MSASATRAEKLANLSQRGKRIQCGVCGCWGSPGQMSAVTVQGVTLIYCHSGICTSAADRRVISATRQVALLKQCFQDAGL